MTEQNQAPSQPADAPGAELPAVETPLTDPVGGAPVNTPETPGWPGQSSEVSLSESEAISPPAGASGLPHADTVVTPPAAASAAPPSASSAATPPSEPSTAVPPLASSTYPAPSPLDLPPLDPWAGIPPTLPAPPTVAGDDTPSFPASAQTVGFSTQPTDDATAGPASAPPASQQTPYQPPQTPYATPPTTASQPWGATPQQAANQPPGASSWTQQAYDTYPGANPAGGYAQPGPQSFTGQYTPYNPGPYAVGQPPAYQQLVPSNAITPDAMTWASASHWITIFSNFVGPLIILLTKGSENTFVRDQAVESLNFQITMLIAYVASFILTGIAIGVLGLIFFPIAALVFVIIAAVAASKGQAYRYPICLRLIK